MTWIAINTSRGWEVIDKSDSSLVASATSEKLARMIAAAPDLMSLATEQAHLLDVYADGLDDPDSEQIAAADIKYSALLHSIGGMKP